MRFSSFGIKRSTLARWTCRAAIASVCIAQAVTASPAAAWSTRPSGPAGFSYVVGEGGTVNLSGVNDIAYGANGKFNYEYAVTGSVSCSNSTFGDPNKGVRKACFVKPVVGPSGFSFVTSEYNHFTISGVADVAYGDSGKYDYKYAMSGGVDCTNQGFGNPDNGVRKACFVKPSVPEIRSDALSAASASTWVPASRSGRGEADRDVDESVVVRRFGLLGGTGL